jgi:asparagine synthase (glutamine-hydrolysing)
MRHAVEIRVPFLDHNLAEKVISLPVNYKISKGINKPLLINSLSEKLPSKIINRTKKGFTFPMGIWIRRNSNYFEECCLRCELLEKKTVREVWNNFRKGRLHWSRVWALVVLSNFV